MSEQRRPATVEGTDGDGRARVIEFVKRLEVAALAHPEVRFWTRDADGNPVPSERASPAAEVEVARARLALF